MPASVSPVPTIASPLDRAHETLLRGTAYLYRNVAPRCDEIGAQSVHAPFIGNALGELDRFLNILVDEVSDWIGVPAKREQRNTANKLDALHLAVRGRAADGDHARLRAIGRSREFLKHAGGRDATGAAHAPQPQLSLSSADMAAICRLYSDTARDLHAAALELRPR